MSVAIEPALQFTSVGEWPSVVVTADAVAKMRELAAASFPLETGGVLIGRYVDQWTALVTNVSGPCPDAKHGPTTFERGVAGLQEMLAALWPDAYYLGDWHTHPAESPEPSDVDLETLRQTAEDPAGKCPEPLLLILGGIAGAHELWSATLWIRGAGASTLQRVGCTPLVEARAFATIGGSL